jgi:monomeric sarcosine oxidase
MTAKVAVIGAGVFGAWMAHHLQQQGHRVTLVDAFGPAHSRSSSGGESRLIRYSYGRDAIYTRMARDSLPQWRQLGEDAGLAIFMPTGVLFFFASEEPYFRDTLAAHSELGLPTEVLTAAAMRKRFPMFDFSGIEVGLFEPDFGALLARRAVQLLVEQFARNGGTYLQAGALPLEHQTGRLEHVRLSSGDRLGADSFVFALGPWLPKYFPDVIGERILPTRQEVFFFAPPPGERQLLPGAMPAWADFNGGDMFYGTPDLEARGVKFAYDRHGEPVDPDTQDRRPSVAALEQIIAYRDRRFPLLRGAPLTEARVCQYENSSTGDFLIDLHPRLENVLLVGGGSGHGFKHGPEVGRYAAARLFGSVEPEARFSLASKSEVHKREVH